MRYHPDEWTPPERSEPFYDADSRSTWPRHSSGAVATAWAIVVALVALTLIASLAAAPTTEQPPAREAQTRGHAMPPGV
jgi:hypothetical protein